MASSLYQSIFFVFQMSNLAAQQVTKVGLSDQQQTQCKHKVTFPPILEPRESTLFGEREGREGGGEKVQEKKERRTKIKKGKHGEKKQTAVSLFSPCFPCFDLHRW